MSARELRQEIERIKVEIRREHLEKNQERGNYLLNYLPEEEAGGWKHPSGPDISR